MYVEVVDFENRSVTLILEQEIVEDVTRDSEGNLSITIGRVNRLRPIYFLPASLDTAWVSFTDDKTWLLVKVIQSDFLAALEIDLTVDDYRLAVGTVENGKLVYQIDSITETSIVFDPFLNELTYIE